MGQDAQIKSFQVIRRQSCCIPTGPPCTYTHTDIIYVYIHTYILTHIFGPKIPQEPRVYMLLGEALRVKRITL